MKKDINLEHTHSINNLACVNFLHGFDYAERIFAPRFCYNSDKLEIGKNYLELDTHVHTDLSKHISTFSIEINSGNFCFDPKPERAIEDYTGALESPIQYYLKKLRSNDKNRFPILLQQGYHVLGFVQNLKRKNLFGLIQNREMFVDFSGLIFEELGRKLNSFSRGLDISGTNYTYEKQRFLLDESSPWRLLGLRIDSSKTEFEDVCRDLIKKYHPDLPTGDKEIFQKISAARDVLEDYFF